MRSARSWSGPAIPVMLTILSVLAPVAAQTRPASPALAALVPKLEGWSLTEAPRSYFPDNLFEYIDGAAESYLGYDFRELIVADFERKGTGATVTLEIYDMGLPVNAFGIFSAERYPENKPAAVGDLGYVEGEALNFLDGRFYVKMLAFGLGQGTEPALGEIGTKVAGAVKTPGGIPAFVRVFPKDGLVPRSEKYIKKNFMGYEFLHDAFVAAYGSGGRELEGFFIDSGSEKDAAGMLTKLVDALEADKQSVEKTPLGVHSRSRYGQHLYIGQVGGVLCGAMRVPDGLEAAGEGLLRAMTVVLAERRAAK